MRLAQPIETKRKVWLRGVDLNHRPLGYEPNELPDCSTPQKNHSSAVKQGQTGWRSVVSRSLESTQDESLGTSSRNGIPGPVRLNS